MKAQSDLKQSTALGLMVLILLLASFFFLVNLNAVSFWEDESWLAIGISGGPLDLWRFATERGVHPPLFFYLADWLTPLMGDSELVLRWLSGLCGLVGIALTYRLGAELAGRQAGLYAALLVSGSIFMIYLARLARQYTLFYTLAAAVVWAYWRWRARPQARGWWYAVLLLQTLALYTHYFSAFIALTIGLHALLTLHWRKTIQLSIALLLSALLFVPWLPSIVIQLTSPLGDGIYYGVPDVPRVLDNYIGRVGNGSLLLFAGLALLGIIALVAQKRRSVALLLFLWIVGTFIPVLLVNEFVFVWYIGRNMFYTLPAIVLLYGIGLAWVGRGYLRWPTLLVAVAFIGWGVYIYNAFWPGTPDWRGLMEGLARDARLDDQYVVDGETYSTDYYLRRFLGEPVAIAGMDAWELAPTLTNRIWLIDSDGAVNFGAQDQIPETMQMTRRLVRMPIVAELYQERPSEAQVVFGDQLAFALDPSLPTERQTEGVLRVEMWWQALRTPDFNYSASVQLWGSNGLVTQVDGNFDSGRLDAQVLPVGVWIPDTRLLPLPADLVADEYELRVTVYDWRDGTRLATDPEAADRLATVGTIPVID